MNNSNRIARIVAVMIGLSSGTIAQAFDGYGFYAFPWFGYGNQGPAAYSLGNIPAPPYFALHPPVYYSRPVPRSYGKSPFACACEGHGPQRAAARVVMNPYVQVRPAKPSETPPASPPANAPEEVERPVKVAADIPLRVTNPFYARWVAGKLPAE